MEQIIIQDGRIDALSVSNVKTTIDNFTSFISFFFSAPCLNSKQIGLSNLNHPDILKVWRFHLQIPQIIEFSKDPRRQSFHFILRKIPRIKERQKTKKGIYSESYCSFIC